MSKKSGNTEGNVNLFYFFLMKSCSDIEQSQYVFPLSSERKIVQVSTLFISIRSKMILPKFKIIFNPYSTVGHVNTICLKHCKVDTNQTGLSRPY